MLNEAQIQYIEEVLGSSAGTFAAGTAESESPAGIIDVLVLTPELSAEEKPLLQKILASVKLSAFTHAEVNEVRLGHLPEGLVCRHVIAFNSEHNGRSTSSSNETVWWSLPSLKSMLGASAEVASNKKEAWTFLQQFARENLS